MTILTMNIMKILIVILFILYVINPLDLIPDLTPIAGWIDDAFLIGVLIYYLKRGRFPGFFSRLGGPFGAGRSDYRQYRGAGGYNQYGSGSGASSSAQASPKDPYKILGIKPGASSEEIHAAYRRAAQTYHPDKVSHLGEEFQELAKDKFVEIQEAYDKITGKRG
jgi:hypothetical protein